MNRLTFKEPNGKWGIIGMNADNEQEKVYGCLCKLLHYEELRLNPDDIIRLLHKLEDIEENLQTAEREIQKESKKVCIGTVIQGYRIFGIMKGYCIAERINKIGYDDFVVWRVDFDKQGVNSGKYFGVYKSAKSYFMEIAP